MLMEFANTTWLNRDNNTYGVVVLQEAGSSPSMVEAAHDVPTAER